MAQLRQISDEAAHIKQKGKPWVVIKHRGLIMGDSSCNILGTYESLGLVLGNLQYYANTLPMSAITENHTMHAICPLTVTSPPQ